jgi:hypothetical protein
MWDLSKTYPLHTAEDMQSLFGAAQALQYKTQSEELLKDAGLQAVEVRKTL